MLHPLYRSFDLGDACNTVVYLTVYPWYGGAAPNNIDPQMQWVIAEIGWPSAGGRETSVANEATNYAVTKKWVSGVNSLGMAFDTFWFEMFDEPWKDGGGCPGPALGAVHLRFHAGAKVSLLTRIHGLTKLSPLGRFKTEGPPIAPSVAPSSGS